MGYADHRGRSTLCFPAAFCRVDQQIVKQMPPSFFSGVSYD